MSDDAAMNEEFLETDEDIEFQNNKFLLFRLGEEVYGINIMSVTDIIEIQKITEVPEMPNYIRGVINLRGQVIPVMDLRLRFRMEFREYDDRTCIIIVSINDNPLGFIVDTVSEVQDIAQKHIDPAPSFKSDSSKDDYILGLGKIEDEVRILLDVEKIARQEELEKMHESL